MQGIETNITMTNSVPECELVLDAVLELLWVCGLELVVGQIVKVSGAELIELGADEAMCGRDACRRLVCPLQLTAPYVHVPVEVDSKTKNFTFPI